MTKPTLPLLVAALLAYLAPAGPRAEPVATPYDFAAIDAILAEDLPQLRGHVAVILHQDGTEIYRFQAGDIDYDTLTRMASFTKTVSAGVILALRDEGLLSLDERLGDGLPLFEARGLGDPTIRDAWAMRHGIDSLIAYERSRCCTLTQSVRRIGLSGYREFEPPGAMLAYDGAGMQAVGEIAQRRTGETWEALARSRIFDPCAMPETDYDQFAPNPSLPGGLRSTPEESIRYARMILDGGWCGDRQVLSRASIEQLFSNETRDLPVLNSPWPADHPLYPYGEDPDYGFGAWVLAQNPDSGHVEEIIGAGAWGSLLWIDRRRGLTAVLFTDVPAGSQASLSPGLGLAAVAREQVDATQVDDLAAAGAGLMRTLTWTPAPGAIATRLYGASDPIRDRFALRDAELLLETAGAGAVVPEHRYYAATALFEALENTALTPDGNTLTDPTRCLGDLSGDGLVNATDRRLLLRQWGRRGDADLDGSGRVGRADLVLLRSTLGACPLD